MISLLPKNKIQLLQVGRPAALNQVWRRVPLSGERPEDPLRLYCFLV